MTNANGTIWRYSTIDKSITKQTLVGTICSFSTINKAIAAGHSNIKVITNITENETIYVKNPTTIVFDENTQVYFSQKNAFIIDGGSLMIRGIAPGYNLEDVKKCKSTISCEEDCVLISPATDAIDCDTFLMYLRIESPGTIVLSGSNITIKSNYFLCKLNMSNLRNCAICNNVFEDDPDEPGRNIKGAYD